MFVDLFALSVIGTFIYTGEQGCITDRLVINQSLSNFNYRNQCWCEGFFDIRKMYLILNQGGVWQSAYWDNFEPIFFKL